MWIKFKEIKLTEEQQKKPLLSKNYPGPGNYFVVINGQKLIVDAYSDIGVASIGLTNVEAMVEDDKMKEMKGPTDKLPETASTPLVNRPWISERGLIEIVSLLTSKENEQD